jgi:hypothetical protein
MKEEIHAALQVLTGYIQRSSLMNDELLEQFHHKLEIALFERYQGHWYIGNNVHSTSVPMYF